jgi:hypothetical protein
MLYKALFAVIFRFLKMFEGGWAYQTDGHRAFESVLGISVLLLINSLAFFPESPKGIDSWVFVIAFAVGAVFFLRKKKYIQFLEEHKKHRYKRILDSLAITYSILSVLSMVYYGYFA